MMDSMTGSMTERELILETRNLSKQFEIRSSKIVGKSTYLHALSDVSIKVYKGETLGIIGESGCGKSTFGKCLMYLHNPTSGEILFHGAPLDLRGRRNRKKRRDIQMIFQDPYSSLNPRKTCLKIIEEPMIIHKTITKRKEREERVAELMSLVGLDTQHVHRYPHEFSGGQRQRINIARALALGPEIIVCDEPISALDVSIQAQVLNLFAHLQERFGLTYLFISHDLSVIRHISDRIAIMYLGRVVELCEADQIYENPLHPYTEALLSAIPPSSPFAKREQIVLEGDIPSPIGEQVGCPLASRCPKCMDRCRKETPELKEEKPGHQVACFLYT